MFLLAIIKYQWLKLQVASIYLNENILRAHEIKVKIILEAALHR